LAVTALFAPALTAPFQWPLLFAVAGSTAWLLGSDGTPALAAMYAGHVPLVCSISGIVYSVFVATGVTMAFAPTLFVALASGLLVPQLAWLRAKLGGRAVVLAIVGSLVVAGVGCLRARYDERQPRADSIVYA